MKHAVKGSLLVASMLFVFITIANAFTSAVSGAPKGEYTRNQFGYAVGGPIIKDKLFFYQSTEWLRVRSNAVVQGYAPTPQFLADTAPKASTSSTTTTST